MILQKIKKEKGELKSMQKLIEAYSNLKKEAFRLELLDEYRVEGEWEYYQMFLEGKEKPDDEEFQERCRQIAESITQGKQYITVHVIPSRLTKYLKFEIEWYYIPRMESGERIYLIRKTDYKKLINNNFKPGDFWLFDEKIVIELLYDASGKFLTTRLIKKRDDVLRCITLKKDLLKHSIPLNKWLLMEKDKH